MANRMNLQFQKQRVAIASAVLVLGCMTANAATKQLAIKPAAVAISTLPSIENDDLRTAISAFERSCAK